jgi:prefoldin subunit 5
LGTLYSAQEGLEDAIAEIAKRNIRLMLPATEDPDPDAGAAWEEFELKIHEALDDLESAVDECASEAENVAQEYNEGADNIEQYFSSSPTAEESRDKAENIENWASSLRSIDFSDKPDRNPEEDISTSADVAIEFLHSKIEEVEGVMGELSL